MHISTVNVLQMLKDKETLVLSSNRNSSMGFQFAYLPLTLIHSKVQGQGHAYFAS